FPCLFQAKAEQLTLVCDELVGSISNRFSRSYRPRQDDTCDASTARTLAHLYVGDYFTDTLDLSAHEHCALRLLVLETWVHGPVGHVRLARVAGLTKEEWQAIKPAVLPLLRGVQPKIVDNLNYIRTFDGQRLPSADWH